MNSGKTNIVKLNIKINFNDFVEAHKDPQCRGQWQCTIITGKTFTLDALGPIPVPLIPLITCHTCGTSFELPKFRSAIEELIAKNLVESNKILSKKQIRFLRLYFDLTQETLANQIGVADRHEMAKIESEKSERTLDTDRQVRLKLFCARLLKIKDAEVLYRINQIDDSEIAKIDKNIFPKTEDEIIEKVS